MRPPSQSGLTTPDPLGTILSTSWGGTPSTVVSEPCWNSLSTSARAGVSRLVRTDSCPPSRGRTAHVPRVPHSSTDSHRAVRVSRAAHNARLQHGGDQAEDESYGVCDELSLRDLWSHRSEHKRHPYPQTSTGVENVTKLGMCVSLPLEGGEQITKRKPADIPSPRFTFFSTLDTAVVDTGPSWTDHDRGACKSSRPTTRLSTPLHVLRWCADCMIRVRHAVPDLSRVILFVTGLVAPAARARVWGVSPTE